ncbi:MAG: acyltransferase domain-containing protein, partial [Xenococcaceae cyanobacterium]
MNFPSVRETYSQIDRLFEQDGLEPISKAVFPPPVFEEADKQLQRKALQQTEIAQGAIAAFSTGLYKILQQAGFKPDFVAGHSFGEVTALWAAGVLSDEDYFFLVKERGQAMASSKATCEAAGAMLAVQGDVSKIKSVIANFNDIAIANWNSPQQIVLAGERAEIIRAQTELEQQGYSAVILPVGAAFHTPQVSHAQAPFAKAIEAVTFNQPQVPVFTNVSGNPYPREPQDCQNILKQHLLSQVLFQEEIENIYGAGGTCFVEFGPRSILTHLVKEILGDRPHLAVALNPSRQKDSDRSLREAVVQLRVSGLSLANLDPYQVVQTKPEAKHPLNVSLTSVNYVSEKTKKFKPALPKEMVEPRYEGEEMPKSRENNQSRLNQDNLTVANTISNNVIKSQQNGSVKTLASMNEVSQTPPDQNSQKSSGSTKVPLESILGSLEYSLQQFHQHQQETLKVHQQYLHYQSQYTQTFFQLMQQQHQLWVTIQNSSKEVEVKTAVINSTERSMVKFQEHQSNTLRVHEQYLNHQAKYAQNFFFLTQQSYAQFLSGNYQLGVNSGSPTPSLGFSQSEDLVTTAEPISTKQIVALPKAASNGNGHHSSSELVDSKTLNGNGHYSRLESVDSKTLNGNGHYPVLNSAETETVNGKHPLAELVKTEVVESNGHYREPELVDAHDDRQAVSPPVPEIDFTILSETLLNVVSEKTGYPPEMLELDMDMEADLGIDSIKRVEILGALQEAMPDLPQPNLEDLGDLHTLNQIIEYLRSFDGAKVDSREVETQTEPLESLEKTLLTIVSEKTGYPLVSLNLDMNLQTDLGIDAVKRRA